MGIIERKEKEHLVRKNSMLNAAEVVFFKNGFENSTMDDIAKEAGFTKKRYTHILKTKKNYTTK